MFHLPSINPPFLAFPVVASPLWSPSLDHRYQPGPRELRPSLGRMYLIHVLIQKSIVHIQIEIQTIHVLWMSFGYLLAFLDGHKKCQEHALLVVAQEKSAKSTYTSKSQIYIVNMSHKHA